jgi:hypothetical protein
MRLAVSHPEGAPHEVDLPGRVVIGRDPSCDIVLSDTRCSRRHAVIDETPDGLVIQDTGSSNGVYVNGRRLDRSPLHPGDRVRLGETRLEVLPDAGATVIVDPDLVDLHGEAPPPPRPPAGPSAPPPPPARPRVRSTRGSTPDIAPGVAPGPPLTLTALSLLWALAAPVCVAGGLIIALRTDAGVVAGVLATGTGLVLAALAGVIAVGLRAAAGWARHLQIAAAALGLLVCPFSFASATVLIYMLRPDVRATFEGTGTGRNGGAGDAEPTFALSLLGMLVLGLALSGAAVLLF